MNSGRFAETTLADVCSSIAYGYTASASDDPSIGPKFLRITDIVPESLVWDRVPHCEIETKKREKFLLDEGDIVVARTGATVGYAKQIWARPEGATFASYLVRFRPDPERVDTRYLGQVVQSSDFKRWVRSVAGGAAQPNANAKLLGSYPLQLPPARQQEAAGRLLWAFDDLIENNRRRIEILEEMARLLFREWFVHFRFPGSEDVDLVDSELGPIPEGWQATRLADVAKWLSGGTPSTTKPEYWGGEIPWITSGSLTSFQLTTSDRRLTEAGVENGSRLVPRDTTLFVVRGMSLAKEFRHGIADVPLAFGQDCKALIAADGLDPLVLAYGVSAMAGDIQAMVEYAAHGTGKLSTDRLQALPFLIPDTETQDRFACAVGPMRELVSNLVRQNSALRAARSLLLPRLVSGELDVSELDVEGVQA